MVWTDSLKSIKIGLAREETAGTAETAPTEYVYTTSESVLNPNMTQDTLRAMGSRGITFTVDKPYHVTGAIPSWAFPEDNGFGLMLYGAFGAAAAAKHGSASYMHTFTVVDTQIPSFTVWCKTSVYETKTSNCQVNKISITNKKASVLDYSADIVGSQLVTATDFGTATYVSGSTKVFRAGGARVFWDDVLSVNVDDVSFNIDNGIDPEEAKSLGTVFANHILAGNRSITGDMTIFVESTTELIDYWGSASGPTLNKDPIKLAMEWSSASIDTATATVGTPVKVAGNGTPTLAASGTYTGTSTHSLFEIKITTAAATDKMMWRKNGGAWSSATDLTAAAQTLEDGVTVTFSAKTGNMVQDRWFFYAGNIPYMFMVYMPTAKITNFQQGASGNRLTAKVSFTAEIDGSTGVGYDAKAFLMNTESTAYNTT